MAYINVAEWTAGHVGDWLRGLDDSVLPYVSFFVNNNVNGCTLLLTQAADLERLNIRKVGHQEIILEAIDLLRQLHYSFSGETLQTTALKVACRSRSLYNALKHSAARNAERAAREAAAAAQAAEAEAAAARDSHGHKHKKDKHKDKHKGDKATDLGTASSSSLALSPSLSHPGDGSTTPQDNSPLSTGTLAAVAEILSAVKEFMSWLDRYPFLGVEKYVTLRQSILQYSIELASTSQRDNFVQGPNDIIRRRCKELAQLCDKLVQELADSLAMQSASLEVITVSKKLKEELGMHIHSSYAGVHQVGGLKYDSPAARNGAIEEGDEIVQVNYQTVVGWQLKKLVSTMRLFPTKIILTVKKRPRHFSGAHYTLIAPFALPIPDMGLLGKGGAGAGRGHSATSAVLLNADQYHGIPQPVMPVPEATYQMSPGAGPHSGSSSHYNGQPPGQLASGASPGHQQAASGTYLQADELYSTGPQNPIPVSAEAYATYRIQQQQPGAPSGGLHGMGTLPKTLSQYTKPSASSSPNGKVSSPTKRSVIQQMKPTAVPELGKPSPNSSVPNGTPSSLLKASLSNQKANLSVSNSSSKKGSNGVAPSSHVHRSKNGSERKSRIATTRCSSASDCSSPYSLSDSSDSTMFSSSGDSSDEEGEEKTLALSPAILQSRQTSVPSVKSTNAMSVSRQAEQPDRVPEAAAAPVSSVSSAYPSSRCPASSKCDCTGSEDSEAEYISGDNDSAFYSGRTTSANDINGSGSASGHSSGGSASGRCSTASPMKMVPPPPKVVQRLASLTLTEPDEESALNRELLADQPTHAQMASTGVNGRPAPIHPRTSAEFEALYLQKAASSSSSSGSQESMQSPSTVGPPLLGAKVGRASTLPPNAQPCSMNDHSDLDASNQAQAPSKPAACNGPSKAKPKSGSTMTAVQQKFVNSLTNLAQNIRVANTVTVHSVTGPNLGPNLGATPTHCLAGGAHKDETSELLRREVSHALLLLTNGSTHQGNFKDTLYLYHGSSGVENGKNSITSTPSLPPLGGQRVDFGDLSSHWTPIQASLQGDTLLTTSLSPCDTANPNSVTFDLPIHHEGYYLLVQKTDLLSPPIRPPASEPVTGKMLYIFKLVTYHYIYIFAAECPAKIAKWIHRLGYAFCCAKAEFQLCFSYRKGVSGPGKSLVNGVGQNQLQTALEAEKKIAQRLAEVVSSTGTQKSEESPACGGRNSPPVTESELEYSTDDYLDLGEGARGHVQFAGSVKEGLEESASSTTRYVKSPHPLGSARFAVRPPPVGRNFIDSKVDRGASLQSATIQAQLEENLAVEPLASPKPVPAKQFPPELPPRSSPTVGGQGPTADAPRPRPRTSKMSPPEASSTPPPKPQLSGRPSVSGQEATPTSSQVSLPSARSLAASLVSSNSRQHLAPIPVPEKSAAISQTIQHFANLQRANNLRRSSQALGANAQTTPTKSVVNGQLPSVGSSGNQAASSNSDYDYIGGPRPAASLPRASPTPPTPPTPPTVPSSPSSGVGNPLYCSMPEPLINRNHSQRALSLESEESSSESSSTASDTCSRPPPQVAPPPPPSNIASIAPPVIRQCLLKPSAPAPAVLARPDILRLTDNNNNLDDDEGGGRDGPGTPSPSAFHANKVRSSPRLVKRASKPTRPPAPLPVESPVSHTQHPQAPPPPSSEYYEVVESLCGEPESALAGAISPPLLPRRSKPLPPPLPTTSHPSLSKANSSNDPQHHPQPNGHHHPPTPPTPPPMNPALLSAKSLNRSFSDAYTRGPRPKPPRKSLESGLTLGQGLLTRDLEPDCGLPPMPTTPTSRSLFIEQLLSASGAGSPLLFNGKTSSTSDLTLNRSLPTMGVSMLAKKRLSNVSNDPYAVERALASHSEAHQGAGLYRKHSVSSFDGHPQTTTVGGSHPTSPLARAASMNSSSNSRPLVAQRRSKQWDNIEQSLHETSRLLKR